MLAGVGHPQHRRALHAARIQGACSAWFQGAHEDNTMARRKGTRNNTGAGDKGKDGRKWRNVEWPLRRYSSRVTGGPSPPSGGERAHWWCFGHEVVYFVEKDLQDAAIRSELDGHMKEMWWHQDLAAPTAIFPDQTGYYDG